MYATIAIYRKSTMDSEHTDNLEIIVKAESEDHLQHIVDYLNNDALNDKFWAFDTEH